MSRLLCPHRSTALIDRDLIDFSITRHLIAVPILSFLRKWKFVKRTFSSFDPNQMTKQRSCQHRADDVE